MEARTVALGVDLDDATLIAGVLEGLDPAPGSEDALQGVDRKVLDIGDFEGKSGQTLSLPHPEAEALLLVGLGEDVSYDSVKTASGNAIRRVKTERAVSLLARLDIDGATRAVVEGSLLGGYEFRAYKTQGDPLDAQKLDVILGDEGQIAEAIVLSEATMLARDWVNTPALDESPETLAGMIREAAEGTEIEVEIWDRPKIAERELGALLGVASGAEREPRVVILKHRPESAVRHLTLVGKGIIFDTGGLSLKSASSMEEMKDDMSGAAAVCAATIGIARLGLPLNVTTIAPLTENAIGGSAIRPGDVLRPVDGPTIEVLNTDAEGRLILADGLSLAKTFDPDLTVDVATLTGAAAVALGREIAAVFGSDSEAAAAVLDAASRAGELFWEMPLHKGYRKSIDSTIADIKNVSGSRYGGAIVAALFLAEYAGSGQWAHIDIAGPARSQETTGEFVKGASGVSVRTLIELARGMSQTG